MSDGISKLRSQICFDSMRYLSWLDKFNVKYGTQCVPITPTKWLKSIVENHTHLQKMIGGHTIKFKVEMRIGQEELAPLRIDHYCLELNKVVPGIWRQYNINQSMLLKWPEYEMSSTIRGIIKKKKIRTSAFIKKYSEKYAKLDDQKSIQLNKILEKIGVEWSKLKNIDKTYYVTVSYSPYAFTKIGHYGPDDRSCFRHQKENWPHKYNLAIAKNSFVFLIKEKQDNKFLTLSRQWGFYNPDGVFNVSNLYHHIIQDNIVQKINHKIFEILLNKPLNLHTNIIRISSRIYHNVGRHDWSFADKNIKTLGQQTI